MSWAPDYVTVADLRAYRRIRDEDDDAQLQLAVTAASRAIDRACNRQFGATTSEARVFTARYDRRRCRWFAEVDDVMATPTVLVDGEAVTDFVLEPVNAAQKGMPWEQLWFTSDAPVLPTGADEELDLTAPWGWTTVPDTISVAALLQASRFHARRDSPWGVAGSPAAGGSELRLLERVDPDVRVMIAKYVRWWAVR